MLDALRSSRSIHFIVSQHLQDEILAFLRNMRYELSYSLELPSWEVKLHVSRMFLEVVEQFFRWCPKNVVDSVNLIQLIIPWEEWKK